MYLVLETPWRRDAPAPQPLVPFATASGGEPSKKASKKRRVPRSGRRGEGEVGDPGSQGDEDEVAPLIELSAADRRLVWRGAEVTLPPVEHDFSVSSSGRALEGEEIAGTIRSQSKPVVDCMVAAATGIDLRTTVTIKMLVDGQGRVTKHRVQAPQVLFDRGLSGCADRAVSRMRFPAVGAFTLVTAPFDLG
jgi:hypothetical protein